MVKTLSYAHLELRNSEIARYARCNYDDVRTQIDEAAELIGDAATYRVCCDVFPITRSDTFLDLGFVRTESKDLRKCLDQCCKVIVFAATAGVGIDRLIQKYAVISPSKAVFLHAAGSEAVEALCNRFCKDMEQQFGPLRPRYSPGYGDVSLSMQKDIFSALSCSKNIGISLNDDLLMSPSKSVTAIIGVIK